MIHKIQGAILLAVLATLALSVSASAERLRPAKAGDRFEVLLAGLVPVNGGPVGTCSADAPAVSYVQYLVPPVVNVPVLNLATNWGPVVDEDNASFVAFVVGKRVVMLVAFDEENPSVPARAYADLDGKGLVTDVWSAAEAPPLCALLQQMHYRP